MVFNSASPIGVVTANRSSCSARPSSATWSFPTIGRIRTYVLGAAGIALSAELFTPEMDIVGLAVKFLGSIKVLADRARSR
ncbi:hypothetical protein [Streptomyces yerevanensis]|uniref:hypothetical protein n=1 Tax=Streptomyces yerevanensis TaxID=66378 RepID=UPI000A4F8F43|nr:hypothetical protein [Streptomyces yerevanensis]